MNIFSVFFSQSPVVGRAGQCGLPVAAHVAAEVLLEGEHAQHHHLPMVEWTVQGIARRERLASYRTAVSNRKKRTLQDLLHQGHYWKD